jgi:hypothetical protein
MKIYELLWPEDRIEHIARHATILGRQSLSGNGKADEEGREATL